MRDISTPLLNVVETGQWAQKVLVRSGRHTSTCVHAYISVQHSPAVPTPLSVCINLISLGNQAEEREAEGSQTRYSFIRL